MSQTKKEEKAACTIWVGKLPEGCTQEDLKSAGEQAGGTVVSTWLHGLPPKGGKSGRIVFASAAEASAAIEALNGAQIGDATIEADVWTVSDKVKGPGKKGKKGKKGQQAQQPAGMVISKNGKKKGGDNNNAMMQQMMSMMQQMAGGGKKAKANPQQQMMQQMMSMMQKMNNGGGSGNVKAVGLAKAKAKAKAKVKGEPINKDLSVWIGNLPKECTVEDLKGLGDQAGNCTNAKLLKKGAGALIFATATEAENALALLNGAQVGDNTIEADVWTGKK